MTMTNEELLERLRKVAMTTGDLTYGYTGLLNPAQAEKFLRLAIEATIISKEATVKIMDTPKWQEPKIVFGSRILRSGIEFTRLDDTAGQERAEPTLSGIEVSTHLVRGEVPISDEVFEDNIEREGFADTIVAMIAERSGLDLEALFIRGLDAATNTYYGMLDGFVYQAATGSGYNVVASGTYGKDYQAIFAAMVRAVPSQFFTDPQGMRFYCPWKVAIAYREQIAARGTPLGDQYLMGIMPLTYEGIKVVGVPMMCAAETDEYNCADKILLVHPKNLLIGFRRQVKLETFRDPREGGTSFIVTARADCKVVHVPATVVATGVTAP